MASSDPWKPTRDFFDALAAHVAEEDSNQQPYGVTQSKTDVTSVVDHPEYIFLTSEAHAKSSEESAQDQLD